MPKIVYNPSQGLVTQGGSGVEFNSDSVIFSATPTTTVRSITSDTTVAAAGVYTLTASQGVLTTVLPLASAIPGGQLIFRSASPSAHILTGSQESVGTKVIAGIPGSSVAGVSAQGSRLTLPGVVGSSVSLVSDGASFMVVGLSGSCTIAGL